MRIETIEIKNFRSIKNTKLKFDDIKYLVGPNGSGKSTVLAALNVVFRNISSSHLDLNSLSKSDFTHEDTSEPISITLTFIDLTKNALKDLSHYVRQSKFILTAEATYQPDQQKAPIKYFGERMGMKNFAPFFEATSASEKKKIYEGLSKYNLPQWQSQAKSEQSLHEYEANNPELCEAIKSADSFFGATKGKGILDRHIQWVYIPAVKDASNEQVDTKNTAISKLVNILVSDRSKLAEQITALETDTSSKYRDLIEASKDNLKTVEQKISEHLATWSDTKLQAKLDWVEDQKSVTLQEPSARVNLQDNSFSGDIARFGHGYQRAYIFSLLQALAEVNADTVTSTIIGCEEPELYQHPSQIKNLSYVFKSLCDKGFQIITTTHNSLTLSIEKLEEIEIVSKSTDGYSNFKNTSYEAVRKYITDKAGESPPIARLTNMPRIRRELEPWIVEMVFSKFVVFLESREDQAYITAAFSKDDESWRKYRSLGISIIPVFGKSRLPIPISIANLLGIPHFVMFDLDSDEDKEDRRQRHKADNRTIFQVMGIEREEFFSNEMVLEKNLCAWPNCITKDIVSENNQAWIDAKAATAVSLNHPPNLSKDPMAIAMTLEYLAANDEFPIILEQVREAIYSATM